MMLPTKDSGENVYYGINERILSRDQDAVFPWHLIMPQLLQEYYVQVWFLQFRKDIANCFEKRNE